MSIIYCIQVGGGQVYIIHSIGATYWCQVSLHVSPSLMSPAKWLYYLPCHLCGTPSATHHTSNDESICGKYIIDKYSIFTDLMKSCCFS